MKMLSKLLAERLCRVLSVAVLAAFTSVWSVHASAKTLRIGGTGSTYGLMQILGPAFAKSRPDVSFEFPPSLGSGGGVRAMLAGAIDLATTSRPLKPRERDAGAIARPFAKTPFILVTSRPGPSLRLDASDVVAMFGLRIAHWPDGSRVRLVLRPHHDSDTTMLIDNFDGMKSALAAARSAGSIPIAQTDQENLDLAESVSGALTTSTLAAVISERRSINPINVGGVAPTVATLEAGTYPMFKILYFALGPNPDPLALDFVDFVRGPTGQDILRANGCLPAKS